ncbi:dTMP kinase [Deinococcus metallilatus]|uniref:Thymidylate kinase n=1 Tax=Deinococcus metallilatus TaxID=1211322 RepID=A0AAJ5F302_9DEIO|nr:dTMP kinase [Deinococcus metallilatus]QBY07984.1 dTMP kinase [Deinococcus metallilatus]RXJ12877.1 dTMP kinase [Deinococcus metallilatus]TLK27201.1 dTMP kinase [Deinococcus metallilatus]GMA16179.1 thymidylate kinase [Deinococcus metallilatus]
MTPGLFVSFEGPEGAGKSTQLAWLAARLAEAGVPHVVTREPGGTPLGTRVREVLLDPLLNIDPLPEFLLYSASRAQLVGNVICPALARGEAVLCDRYADSSLAYQGAGRGLDPTFLAALTREVTGGLVPDLTVLLDLDPALGLARAASRGQPDRLERADLGFHGRVRAGFLALAAQAPRRFLVLDATRDPGALADAIWQAVRDRLSRSPADRSSPHLSGD